MHNFDWALYQALFPALVAYGEASAQAWWNIANVLASGEGAPVIIASATIDKVTIATKPPEARNEWRYWLLTTPYGTQLLALLEMLSAGGWSIGGLPERTGFRKIGGTFC